jgi:hypothetical protein
MFVVPELGCDPKLLALDSTLNDRLKRSPNLPLVTINGSTIEMPVPDCCRTSNSLGYLICCDMIGPEGTQADSRHRGAGKQLSLRD